MAQEKERSLIPLLLRKRAKKTQRQIAVELGITESVVSKWERGVTVPSHSLIYISEGCSNRPSPLTDFALGQSENNIPSKASEKLDTFFKPSCKNVRKIGRFIKLSYFNIEARYTASPALPGDAGKFTL